MALKFCSGIGTIGWYEMKLDNESRKNGTVVEYDCVSIETYYSLTSFSTKVLLLQFFFSYILQWLNGCLGYFIFFKQHPPDLFVVTKWELRNGVDNSILIISFSWERPKVEGIGFSVTF